MNEELKEVEKDAVRSSRWSFFSAFVDRVGRLLVLLLLAVFLQPKDFGVMAVALIFVEVSSTVCGFGLSASIIAKEEVDHSVLNQVFTINALAACVLYSLLVATSSWIETFFEYQSLGRVLTILGLSIFASSMGTASQAWLEKNLRFKQLFASNFFSFLSYAASSILMAMSGWGVFALVYAHVISRAVRMTLVIAFSRHIPRPTLSFKDWRYLFGYGMGILGHNIVVFVSRNIDRFIIGKFFDSNTMGFYDIGVKLASNSLLAFAGSFSRVLFPSLVKLKSKLEILKDMYLNAYTVLVSVCLATGMFVYVNSGLIMETFFRNEWSEAAPFVGLLAIWSGFEAIIMLAHPGFRAINKQYLALLLTTVKSVVITGVMMLVAYRGALAICYANLATSFIFALTVQGVLLKNIGAEWREKLKLFLTTSLIAALFFLATNFSLKLMIWSLLDVRFALATQVVIFLILFYLYFRKLPLRAKSFLLGMMGKKV